MAQRVIQLLRSGSVYASKEAAMAAVVYPTMTGADGEVRIARYFGDNNKVKDLLCVFHETTDSTSGKTNDPGWTYIEDASDIAEILSGLDGNINATAPVSPATDPTATDPNKVVTAVLEVDGVVTGADSNITGVKLAGYAEASSVADVAATDTLGQALGKLQKTIHEMDLSSTGGSGKVVTTVAQADGVVTASASDVADVLMGGYSKTSDTGAIASTDTIEKAFSKVENAITANKVASADKTVTVTDGTTGTDLAVNIDGTTIVKNSTTGVLKADLELTQLTAAEITALSDNNVKEAYKLIYSTDSNRTAIGNVVKIYKDSSLVQVYLGSDADTQSGGVITKYAYELISDPTTKITAEAFAELTTEQKALYEAIDAQSLNFLYQLADGTYELVKVDVSKFLTENEFGDGLQVSGAGVVSVKVDSTSEKVRIDDTPEGVTPGSAADTGLAEVLSVSSNGVKVDNIQDAIDYAVSQSTASLAVTAEGDAYVGASVDAATDNKHVVVDSNVQDLTATAGTPGTYNSTTGAQTTAPTNGTLSGTANSLADSSDIATKVKTYVDGQVAIEAARSDAKNTADIYALDATQRGNLDNSDELTTGHKVGVKVVEEHGLITGVTVVEGDIASATEVDNIETAVGLNADGTFNAFSGTNYLNSTTTIKGAITALDTELGNGLNSVSNTDHSITVGTKANKDQEISLNLDTTTTTTTANNQYSSSQSNPGSGSNVLQVTQNGLYLSEVWDCGTF